MLLLSVVEAQRAVVVVVVVVARGGILVCGEMEKAQAVERKTVHESNILL